MTCSQCNGTGKITPDGQVERLCPGCTGTGNVSGSVDA